MQGGKIEGAGWIRRIGESTGGRDIRVRVLSDSSIKKR